MNRVGMLTSGVVDPNNIEEGYRQLAEAGFDCIDFKFDTYLNIKRLTSMVWSLGSPTHLSCP